MNNDADACLSDDDMESRMKFFYDFRTRTNEWYRNGIKNLKYTECKCERHSNVPMIDFDKVNHEEIEELIPRKENVANIRDIGIQCNQTDFATNDKDTSTENMASVRDIGVQCYLKDFNTNDESTSTDDDDFQQALQLNPTEGQKADGQCSGNTIDCLISFNNKWRNKITHLHISYFRWC